MPKYNRTSMPVDKGNYIKFFARCSFYKIVPSKLVSFFMERFNDYDEYAEQILQEYMKSENIKYTENMRSNFNTSIITKSITKEDLMKSDLYDDITVDEKNKF